MRSVKEVERDMNYKIKNDKQKQIINVHKTQFKTNETPVVVWQVGPDQIVWLQPD